MLKTLEVCFFCLTIAIAFYLSNNKITEFPESVARKLGKLTSLSLEGNPLKSIVVSPGMKEVKVDKGVTVKEFGPINTNAEIPVAEKKIDSPRVEDPLKNDVVSPKLKEVKDGKEITVKELGKTNKNAEIPAVENKVDSPRGEFEASISVKVPEVESPKGIMQKLKSFMMELKGKVMGLVRKYFPKKKPANEEAVDKPATSD